MTGFRTLAVAMQHGAMDIRQQSAATRLDMAAARTCIAATRADLAAHRLDFATAGANVLVTRVELEAARAIAAAKEEKNESTDPSLDQLAASREHLSGTGKWFLYGLSKEMWECRNSVLRAWGFRIIALSPVS